MKEILGMTILNPIFIIVVVIVLFLIFTYNNLNAKKNRVKNSFSTIDIYLQKRFDEISALLEQALTAYKHEENIHSQVAALRSGIETAKNGTINDKVHAVNKINGFIASPAILTEAYPELKAISDVGLFVSKRTSHVEDELAAARKQYNNNATLYNTKISSFPTNLVASLLGFKTPFELFKISEEKRERPNINDIKNKINQ